MDIISKVCSSEHVHSTVFEDWSVMVVDENWKHRQKLTNVLTPFFKKVELIFDVKDAVERINQQDDNIDLVLFGISPTEKETAVWTANLEGLDNKPKVVCCADYIFEEVKSAANAIAADGCLAISQRDEQVMERLADAIGEKFSMPDETLASQKDDQSESKEIIEDVVEDSVVDEPAIIEEAEQAVEEPVDADDAVTSLIKDAIPMPESSSIVLDLRELFARNKRTRAEEIEDVVDVDYKLKNRVLKAVVANFFGVKVKTKIASISHAVNLVGMKPVVNFINLISLNSASAVRTGKITDFAYKYWKYALANGIACVNLHPHIASKWLEFDSSDAFMLGALHNLGILLMAKEFPDEYPNMMLEFWRKHHSGEGQVELEKEEFGFNHAQVSAVVAKEWQMPQEFQEAIINHHDLLYKGSDEKQNALHAMLVMSNYMTNHYLFNNFDFTLLNKDVESLAKLYGKDLDSLKKMKELIRSQLMANINLIG